MVVIGAKSIALLPNAVRTEAMPPAAPAHAEDEQCLPLPFEPALEGDEDCETGRARLVGHPHDDLLALHSLRTVELAIGGWLERAKARR